MLKWNALGRLKHKLQAEVCKSVDFLTVKEVKVEKEFIVAVFWNNKEN